MFWQLGLSCAEKRSSARDAWQWVNLKKVKMPSRRWYTPQEFSTSPQAHRQECLCHSQTDALRDA
jgi:hypothetical protein